MTATEERQAEVRKRSCPTCKAEAGTRCVSLTRPGAPRMNAIHHRRYALAAVVRQGGS